MNKLNVTCVLSGKDTAGKISVFEEIVAPNSGPPLHTHETQYEIFHVISGHIQFEVEGERSDVFPGGVALIPPKAKHGFINKSEGESIIHFELLPSGSSEKFFQKLTPGEFEDIPKFFEEHGLRFLGPPIT